MCEPLKEVYTELAQLINLDFIVKLSLPPFQNIVDFFEIRATQIYIFTDFTLQTRMDTPEADAAPRKAKQSRKNLSPKSKASLICMLKGSSDVKKSGKTVLPKAVEALAMEQFGVSKGQVRKLCDAGKDVNLGHAYEFKELLEKVGNKRKGNSGRKLVQLE